jgi:molybdopterin-guanine dinucleotide biosynthesis adapter protein
MNNTKFIGIVGHKKSGKTTMVEQLSRELTSRGLIIGTIKLTTHDLEFDSPGKDTYRHRKAGSKVTLIKSKSQIALFAGSDYVRNDLTETIFGDCDFVFIEGDSSSARPKIYVADEHEIRNDIAGDIIAVWGKQQGSFDVVHFNDNQIENLCDFLINKFKPEANNMLTESEMKIELNVNGQIIEMNEFVQKITTNLFLAVLKSIRLADEPKTAVLTMKIN